MPACEPIAIGMNTDAYQPIERDWKITRSILEVLCECEHPFSLISKSALIERDLDLIAPMAAKGMARAYFSITSLDRKLSLKVSIHRALLDKINLAALDQLPRAQIEHEIREIVHELLRERREALNAAERDEFRRRAARREDAPPGLRLQPRDDELLGGDGH